MFSPEEFELLSALGGFFDHPKTPYLFITLYATSSKVIGKRLKARSKRKDNIYRSTVQSQMGALKNKMYVDLETMKHEYHEAQETIVKASFERGIKSYKIQPYLPEIRSVYENCIDNTIEPQLVQILYDERNLYRRKNRDGKLEEYCNEIAERISLSIAEDIGKVKGRSDILEYVESSSLSVPEVSKKLKAIFERAISESSFF